MDRNELTPTERLRDRLAGVVTFLASPDDSLSDITARLASGACQGWRMDPWSCPVAVYVSRRASGRRTTVTPTTVIVDDSDCEGGSVTVETPSVLTEWMARFDAGAYPRLDRRLTQTRDLLHAPHAAYGIPGEMNVVALWHALCGARWDAALVARLVWESERRDALSRGRFYPAVLPLREVQAVCSTLLTRYPLHPQETS